MAYSDRDKWHIPCFLPIDGIGSALLGLRKEYIREWEFWLAEKKIARDNLELARFARGEGAVWLKRLRACRLLLPYFVNEPPRDCLPAKDEKDFPPDLFNDLNVVLVAAESATWSDNVLFG